MSLESRLAIDRVSVLKKGMIHIAQILNGTIAAIMRVVKAAFGADVDIMSDELEEILSNAEDKEKIINAINEIKKTDKEEITITLHNKEELTLIR